MSEYNARLVWCAAVAERPAAAPAQAIYVLIRATAAAVCVCVAQVHVFVHKKKERKGDAEVTESFSTAANRGNSYESEADESGDEGSDYEHEAGARR
jgi:hypothetical protein